MSAVAPRFIFTVDVEVGKSHDAEARIWGRCVEGEFGIGFQLEQLRQRGFGGSFFVNVYESRRHGAEFFGKVCRRIVESGSDVELHTHPDGWTEDWSRPYMWQYTLAEQVELVRLGQKMLADWTGSPAIAHRAGSFAANDDTLRACIANGLRIDSSEAFRLEPMPFAFFVGAPERTSCVRGLAARNTGHDLPGPVAEPSRAASGHQCFDDCRIALHPGQAEPREAAGALSRHA